MSSQSETSPSAKRMRTAPTGRTDISQSTGQAPTQPNMLCLPPVKMGGRDRRFNKKYYTEHKWVEFSAALNKIFCFPCLHYGKNASAAWTTVGFGKYDSTSSSLKQHEASTAHTLSATAWSKH